MARLPASTRQMRRRCLAFLPCFCITAAAAAQDKALAPPGRLVDIGGYRIHLYCIGAPTAGRPTIVLSAGGGDFAVDWSKVQRPLGDSARVCSYDRPGYGWSDPGPYSRTFAQEAAELHTALARGGESPPFIVVGNSIGAFVVRQFANAYRPEVVGMVLVGPTNENGKLGYQGRFVLMRTLATARPIPPVHTLAESPPTLISPAECDSSRARAERGARIVRPYDQLGAQAQRYRLYALGHPSCAVGRDDFFAEQIAVFFNGWRSNPHPLNDLPLIVVMGTQKQAPPPGLSEAEWRSDTLRIDLSKLSRKGKLVTDSLSGHHIQLDNPIIVIDAIRELMRDLKR